MNRKTVPGRDSAAPSWSAPVANRITATESLTQKAFNCLLQQNRHKADILTALSNVRFSNRPFGVKHFQTIRRCGVDVTHGLVLLFGIGTKALPSWDSRTRWSNLWGGLAVRRTAGPSGHAKSPNPSSREGHHSTAGWNSSFLLLRLILLLPRLVPASSGIRCRQPRSGA